MLNNIRARIECVGVPESGEKETAGRVWINRNVKSDLWQMGTSKSKNEGWQHGGKTSYVNLNYIN